MGNTPNIRFKGFTDDWEQRKLNEYLQVSKVKNKDAAFSKEDVLSVSGDYGIVNQIEFQGRSFAGVSVAAYGVVETGDVVYTKSPLKSNPYDFQYFFVLQYLVVTLILFQKNLQVQYLINHDF